MTGTLSVLPGRLLVTRDPLEERTASGRIILPANERKVAATGFCHLHEPVGVENLTGKRIVFERWTWRTFTLDGHEFTIVREGAVLAVEDE